MDNVTLKKIADNLDYLKAVSVRIDTPLARETYTKAKNKVTDLVDGVTRQNEKDRFTQVVKVLRAAGVVLAKESDKDSALPAADRDFLDSFPRIRQVRF